MRKLFWGGYRKETHVTVPENTAKLLSVLTWKIVNYT